VACNYHYLGWVLTQKIIQIYPCLIKLSHKQDTILKIVDFSTKNYDFPPKPLLQILPCKNPSGFGRKSIFTSEVYSVQSGVLPVYYSGHAAIYSILQ
jgi:hypothetical protein